MSTPSTLVYQGDVTTVTENYFYPQPNPAEEGQEPNTGGNWVFTVWSAGTEFVNNGSCKIELFWDNGDDMQLVDAIYTSSETYQHDLDNSVLYPFEGGDVFRVVVRRTVLGGSGAREIYAQVQGFVA